jgi:peptidyl-prolyl cis-trans isomerase B (cyclophilin B)
MARPMAWGRAGAAAVLSALILMGGCGKHAAEAPEDNSAPTASSAASAATPAKKPAPKVDPFLAQSFAEATVADAPEDQELPAQTRAGMSVGKLYTEVIRLWKQIPFVNEEGKRLSYSATVQTDLGDIEITFRPDIAPNHVRSFIALARAGYYDGLVFERTVHLEADNASHAQLDFIEAGCPLGTGDENYGSIGYWLKPEFSDQVHHEEGSVGAWHKEEADTAACKFYITLGKAPYMDGNFTVFGKVTRGLDIARKIAERPLDPDNELKDRPKDPVVIRKVTVHVRAMN